jgi:hypothetical protein
MITIVLPKRQIIHTASHALSDSLIEDAVVVCCRDSLTARCFDAIGITM